MSQKYYEREFLKKVIKLRLEEGRTIPSLCSEYGIARSTVSTWCKQYVEEFQNKSNELPESVSELSLMKEILKLKKELEDKNKEILF